MGAKGSKKNGKYYKVITVNPRPVYQGMRYLGTKRLEKTTENFASKVNTSWGTMIFYLRTMGY